MSSEINYVIARKHSWDASQERVGVGGRQCGQSKPDSAVVPVGLKPINVNPLSMLSA